MHIREDSKKILCYFLDKAIEYGDMNMVPSDFRFSYDSLAKDLDLKDGKYCRVCCQYLAGHKYMDITVQRTENGVDENSITFEEKAGKSEQDVVLLSREKIGKVSVEEETRDARGMMA